MYVVLDSFEYELFYFPLTLNAIHVCVCAFFLLYTQMFCVCGNEKKIVYN